MALLVDTTVFILLERRRLDLEALAAMDPATQDEDVSIATITASELLVGVHRAVSNEQQMRRGAFVESILERLPVLPFDLRSARVHARLVAQLDREGARIGAHDLLIAATALNHGCAVLTTNIRDFSRVPGLDVRPMQ